MIDDDYDDLEWWKRHMGGAFEGANKLIAGVVKRDGRLATAAVRVGEWWDSINDRLHVQRLLIVKRAYRGVELGKHVEETVSREIDSRRLLGDLAWRHHRRGLAELDGTKQDARAGETHRD